MSKQFDYYYTGETEQFQFYQVPKAFIEDPEFRPLSLGAKLLYGFLSLKDLSLIKCGNSEKDYNVFLF